MNSVLDAALPLVKLIPGRALFNPDIPYQAISALAGKPVDVLYSRLTGLSCSFFAKGWGDLGVVDLANDVNFLIQEWPFRPLQIDWKLHLEGYQDGKPFKVYEGKFKTPCMKRVWDALPPESRTGVVQLMVPAAGACDAAVVHLAATGDEGFTRRARMAAPLVSQGVANVILESPFYGCRRPGPQLSSKLQRVSDLLLLGWATIFESMHLLLWLRDQGYEHTGLSGTSMGGVHACLTASLVPHPVACVPFLAPRSAAVAYCDGAMWPVTAWQALRPDTDEANNDLASVLAAAAPALPGGLLPARVPPNLQLTPPISAPMPHFNRSHGQAQFHRQHPPGHITQPPASAPRTGQHAPLAAASSHTTMLDAPATWGTATPGGPGFSAGMAAEGAGMAAAAGPGGRVAGTWFPASYLQQLPSSLQQLPSSLQLPAALTQANWGGLLDAPWRSREDAALAAGAAAPAPCTSPAQAAMDQSPGACHLPAGYFTRSCAGQPDSSTGNSSGSSIRSTSSSSSSVCHLHSSSSSSSRPGQPQSGCSHAAAIHSSSCSLTSSDASGPSLPSTTQHPRHTPVTVHSRGLDATAPPSETHATDSAAARLAAAGTAAAQATAAAAAAAGAAQQCLQSGREAGWAAAAAAAAVAGAAQQDGQSGREAGWAVAAAAAAVAGAAQQDGQRGREPGWAGASALQSQEVEQLQRQVALLKLKAVLEAFTDITRFPVPKNTAAAILIAACDDAYVTTESVREVHQHWRGSEMRLVPGGHVSAFITQQHSVRQAILDALARLRG